MLRRRVACVVAAAAINIVASCTIVPLETSAPESPPALPSTPFQYDGRVIQIRPKPESVPDAAGWAVQELVRRGPWARGFIWVDEATCKQVCTWTRHIVREAPLGEGCLISFDWIGLAVLSNENLVVAPRSTWCINAGATHCQRYVSCETGPELVSMKWPQYPESVRISGAGSAFYCHVYVDPTGKVGAIHMMSECDPLLAEAALGAARTAVYKPARRKDKSPIAVWAVIPFDL